MKFEIGKLYPVNISKLSSDILKHREAGNLWVDACKKQYKSGMSEVFHNYSTFARLTFTEGKKNIFFVRMYFLGASLHYFSLSFEYILTKKEHDYLQFFFHRQDTNWDNGKYRPIKVVFGLCFSDGQVYFVFKGFYLWNRRRISFISPIKDKKIRITPTVLPQNGIYCMNIKVEVK